MLSSSSLNCGAELLVWGVRERGVSNCPLLTHELWLHEMHGCCESPGYAMDARQSGCRAVVVAASVPGSTLPVIFFFGAPNASRHVAEVIVTPLDHMNTSAESLHYKLLLRCK